MKMFTVLLLIHSIGAKHFLVETVGIYMVSPKKGD